MRARSKIRWIFQRKRLARLRVLCARERAFRARSSVGPFVRLFHVSFIITRDARRADDIDCRLIETGCNRRTRRMTLRECVHACTPVRSHCVRLSTWLATRSHRNRPVSVLCSGHGSCCAREASLWPEDLLRFHQCNCICVRRVHVPPEMKMKFVLGQY